MTSYQMDEEIVANGYTVVTYFGSTNGFPDSWMLDEWFGRPASDFNRAMAAKKGFKYRREEHENSLGTKIIGHVWEK